MVEDKALELFGEELLKQMSSSNWKERLASVEEMTKVGVPAKVSAFFRLSLAIIKSTRIFLKCRQFRIFFVL